ncbi:hypothetical protein QTP86_021287, partial [Hemibagrus guttatus]
YHVSLPRQWGEKMTRWAKNVRKHKSMDAASWRQLSAGISSRPNSSGSFLQDDASHPNRRRANKNRDDVNGFIEYMKHKRQPLHNGRRGMATEEKDIREVLPIALKKNKRREYRRIKRQNATKSNMVCFNCRKPGHGLADCPKADGEEMGRGICFRCGSTEHDIQRCRAKVDPAMGCELEEKERFWSELDEVMESIPTGERVVIGADFNGHVGEGNTGDEEVMGKFGVKERNLEGQMVVDFAKRMDMGVVNTYFQKREEHRVTYKSGGRRTQVDYILCRRGNLKEISDCKVVVGESVARQHRMVVCRMTLMVCKKKRSEIEKKTKWWKLKKEECCEEFRQKLRQALGGQVVLPDDWETTAEVIRETGRKVLGVSSGRRKEDKETWWWNEEVQDSVQRKRLAKKKWDMDRTEENRQEYKELQRRVKREVSKAKQKAYDELYTRLDTREGEKDLYRLARQRDRDGKDVQLVRVIKDRDGRVLTSEESVQRRWKEYFEELMNEENEREKRVEGVNSVEQKVDKIRKDEVRKALKRMKSGKAVGPDDIPVEVWKCLGEAAVEFLASLFNRVLESERMPEEWRRSVLVPIFKNKGDVQSCSNYRGIKLMSHTMKVWERVVEARLRKVVEICEQQYGFMPRKSTTDAIFALRILMEKYRDGQRELHCVFVDLEKAYDRVPREELWYCMRKSGVAEKYVRVVQDMYERSRTVVRCAVGQTEEFNVEVGLHQGSALSPFLFAIVMDQLSEEVRQESPWTMMFADDIVICSESREQVEENLERWRFALERRGMKVSRSKTEYMCVNEREGSGTVRLQGEEVKKVQEFKYLGSTVQSNGECGKEVKKRVQAGWNGWRKVSGVLCDQKISARIKGKVYRTVVRPAMLYGLETVSLRKRQESELEVAELKMLRFSLGVTRLDRIRNEYIRGTAHVGRLGDKVMEARLRWFGHVQRRESDYPYAKCFICGKTGHISKSCPDNPKGLYAAGGCCRICGSVEHFQKDCPDHQIASKAITIGRLSNKISADHEDVSVPVTQVSLKKAKVVVY